jgi:enoyl-CoA hydratase/carnithine racemase
MSEPDTQGAVLLSEDRGPVRLLTMNRPDKLNALNFALTEALTDAFKMVEADPSVNAVILTGNGRGFCAGADTTEFHQLTPGNGNLVEQRAALTMSLHAAIPRCRVPVIAAVNGFALGGGSGLALACDYVIAADTARFGYPEVKHGIVAAIVLPSLVRQVGRKVAFDLVASGRQVSAAEAAELRMINRAVAPAALLDAAWAFATEIAGYSPVAMAETKRLLQATADLGLHEGLELGRQANARMRAFGASKKPGPEKS